MTVSLENPQTPTILTVLVTTGLDLILHYQVKEQLYLKTPVQKIQV